jgi:tetratricopeptide (TPR) repeat protein
MELYLIHEEISRGANKFKVSLLTLLAAAVLAVFSDTRSVAQQPEPAAIRGVVDHANGSPVPDAAVQLQQAGTVVARTHTDVHGSFAFERVQPGNYLLRADKADMHASATISTGDKETHITLVAAATAAGSESMDFADRPNFTVAGITDWTAVGGHGSDASLRTSENLASATATLKQDRPIVAAQTNDIESMLRAAAMASAQSFTANRELGRFYLQTGKYREAELPLEVAYQIDPADRSNEYDLALVYKEVGDLKRAREHVKNLLVKESTADLHRLAGDVDERMDDPLAAEREYETAVRLDPSELNEFTWGAELLSHRAVWAAIEVFRKGTASYPQSARMLSALGAALFASAQYEEAAQRLCEASDLNPVDNEPYIFLGEIEMAAPTPLACAEQKLARFALEQPRNSRAQYYYAMAILKRQAVPAETLDIEHARSLLTTSVEINPKYGEGYLQLGILSESKKDYARAIDYFTRAIEANPQLADAHYRLGIAYGRVGAEAKAKQEFERHDEIKKVQAEATEQQRRDVKQFIVVLQGQPSRSK